MAPCELLGAQPTVLHAPYALISHCWLGAVDEAARFLARVRDLRIKPASDVDPIDPTDVARVLRVAPQLKKFYSAHRVHGDASWLAPTAATHPAFDGLVNWLAPAFEGLMHSRLREFGIRTARAVTSVATPRDADWAAHLRRRHFPRLRELVIGDEAYFVTSPDRVLLEIGAAT
jgi:hypothetical protein